MPSRHRLTEGDGAQGHQTEGCPAGQGPRNAARGRTREEGDNDQDEEAEAVEQVELQRRHAPSCAAAKNTSLDQSGHRQRPDWSPSSGPACSADTVPDTLVSPAEYILDLDE